MWQILQPTIDCSNVTYKDKSAGVNLEFLSHLLFMKE